ncbi:imidazole glycerol phosphate synthase subunit HisH [Roseobacter ponti]|uniref:Imidazole glycerol phosphate synthase subunit HisH n=1 Tax=Roseobacter ponti TaxID=1891787 RepID=A0A858SXZ6_9RHOB|nr:imidazole glycerol phosphate synthase subunit HisH [Roseobacter ponti]QJF52878.1 imidazole glycerol phosphate synthase subunit HisH [Roseobacter ponti]
MTKVSVLNYGIGNLKSVVRALEHVGADLTIITDAAEVRAADRLVLPGVGAFSHCTGRLRELGLWDALSDYVAGERPFLGICVGMQLMMQASEEFGLHEGLGLVQGRVARLPDELGQKIPMVGWKTTTPCAPSALLPQGENPSFYFVHSFAATGVPPESVLATYRYGASDIVAAVGTGTKFGTQFHPEKSGRAGLALLERFVAL